MFYSRIWLFFLFQCLTPGLVGSLDDDLSNDRMVRPVSGQHGKFFELVYISQPSQRTFSLFTFHFLFTMDFRRGSDDFFTRQN